jgi:Flp pilus assembly protein TadG
MRQHSIQQVARAFRNRLARDKRGQVSVIFGLSAVALTATVGTSMDAAAVHRSATQLQSAADAAALHAVHVATGTTLSDAEIAAAAAVFLEGAYNPSDASDAASENTTVVNVVSRDPVTVEVSASRVVDLPFGFLREEGTVTVTRTATAVEAVRTPVSLLLLERDAAAAWSAGGSSTVTLDNGAAVVNSSSAQALSGSGSAEITASATFVAGPVQAASAWTPTPSFNHRQVDDPFASTLSWPATGSCVATDLSIKKQSVTLQPGTYCGGIDLATHADVTLAPGVYVLTGPLTVASHATLNAPVGVSIILKSDTSYVRVQSGAEVTIRAPKTGAWKNIAIAQAPQSTEVTSTLIGGGELDLDGVLYFPTQKVVVTGGGSAGVATGSRILIANRLSTQGSGSIHLRGDEDVFSINMGSRLKS